MPSQLRKPFVVICAFGEVEDVRSLWEQFKDVLCEDLVHRFSSDTGQQYALAEMNQLLNFYGLCLKKINLPHTNFPSQLNLSTIDVVKEESEGRQILEIMNEQKFVVQKVLSVVYENKAPKLFFLDGPAGTKKTFVYSTLIHIIIGKGDQVTSVVSTGIAATLLDGGRTAHSVFKIPLMLDATSTCNVKSNSPEAKLLRETKLII
ncbi:hypothetical protein AVEN_127828-1 [Araneus ventricosus]|uniref:ATP-dependent DNA helicase n=1 Tax=Araneus ventricosus TaxID=182803 RepID=A0A4Y1ZZE0_ARAVE|nr:hypothetical protein AVEN_127828-1 [Araneus ventricosus]